MEEILTAKGITREYRIDGRCLPVLKGVDVEVRKGQILAIIGKSGVGKSTLLHILGALDVPTQGSVAYEGRDLASLSAKQRAAVRNRDFGFTFQFYHLLPEFTALENVLLPALIDKGILQWLRVRPSRRERAESLLAEVGLSQRQRHKPSQLSGGERQRVAIARALMNEPSILFCDEPTGNLDTKTGGEIIEMLWRLNRDRRQTIVLVTHDEAMARDAHAMVRMVDGKVTEKNAARKGQAKTA